MPPKNKSAGSNGFIIFAMELKQRQGFKYNNMADLVKAADPLWKNLSQEQKDVYSKKAKAERGSVKKFTTYGIDVDVVEKQEYETKLKEINMQQKIRQSVSAASNRSELEQFPIHILDFNIYCFANSTKRYYPAEVSIVRFNLSDGVMGDNIYHEIINPGPIPLGYSYLAKETSDNTHNLPPPNSGDCENNLEEVLNGIIQFMTKIDYSDYTFPPFYVDSKNMEVAESILQMLCLDYGHPEDLFTVHSLQYFFYTLRNSVSDEVIWPTITLANLEVEKDPFDYTKGIACVFHEDRDTSIHCSRSKVIRVAYNICKCCCDDLNIPLTQGRHVPGNAMAVHRAPSRAESQSNFEEKFFKGQKSTHQPRQMASVAPSERSDSPSSLASFKVREDVPESDMSQDNWQISQSKHRGRRAPPPSLEQTNYFEEQLSQASSATTSLSQVCRRPVSVASALTQGASQLNDGPKTVGRGRGRNIASRFSNN